MLALQGIRVLDLSRVRSGPACCRVMCDFGAEVIKVEAPEGVDPNAGISGDRHGYDMLNLHRNKKSITLNLKTQQGIDIFKKLVKGSDVVVENFRPDVKTKLGIDYESLKKINQGIILASISGFGQDGPYQKRAGFDQIAQGMGGLMALTGHKGEGPMRAGAAISDFTAGLYACIGILLALNERKTSGKGQWITTSLLEAQLAILDFQVAKYLIDGVVPEQVGNEHPYSTPMGVIKTSDGYINIAVGGDGQWAALCAAINKPEWSNDKRFKKLKARYENRQKIWSMLADIFNAKTSKEWLDLLAQHGVPAGPIYKMDEVFDDPQVQHLSVYDEIEHPIRGKIKVLKQPLSLSRTPSSILMTSPEPGEHNDSILGAIGYDKVAIQNLKDQNVI